ncbi:MAG: hypothetical protein ACLFU9_06015 [Candidatus Bathyarchaeia archaeon]
MSPQIRCPNCGITINSMNRKKMDISLIVHAVNKKPRSFTDLLKLTKLPRKTLSNRLKELIGKGVITKNGLYYLNGDANVKELCSFQKNPFVLSKRTLVALLVLAIMIPSSIHAYAIFQLGTPLPSEPTIKGYFTANLYVYDVQDVYGWQAVILYDSDNTRMIDVLPGLLETDRPLLFNANFPDMGLILVGNTLVGQASGRSGTGRCLLASIVFAYYSEDFDSPVWVPEFMWHKTKLLNSNREMSMNMREIPLDILELEIVLMNELP